ncbi:MAG: serine/threonine-protein kinase [Myxococcota bacterium]
MASRFRREGLTATRVSHPNAVRVLDSGVSSAGIPYLVMELLVGRTLTQRMRAEGPLAVAEGVAVARAISEALAVAHAEGIVHRDIKPDNVFLEGPTQHVKLLDFGIARLLDDTGADALDAITRTGQLVGTPAYMAPERLQGMIYDGRSDVYSVGVLLYEALSGTRPFDSPGRTPWEIIRNHLSSPVPLLADVVEGLPTELLRISAWALARDPAERPTARQLADALAAVPLPTAGPASARMVGRAPPVVSSDTLDSDD